MTFGSTKLCSQAALWFCRTVGLEQQAAFSVARYSSVPPEKGAVIRFAKVITNINDDYDTETGRFR